MGNNEMKKIFLLTVIGLLLSTTLVAAETQYNLRVDGLACPFCAYGIEKKLIRTEGVRSVAFDFEKGLVMVKVKAGVTLTEAQLKSLINDAGFTLRAMSEETP